MNILFLVPYPLKESPSQRFRFEQYFSLLKESGHQFTIQSFLDSDNWRLYTNRGKTFTKLLGLLRGFLKRLQILFKIRKFDYVFIHREAAPIGPPVLEWVIAKVLRKKVIYDFDDAIWLTDRGQEPLTLRIIKWRSKVANICRWSFRVSCGNSYLCAYARQFNDKVVLNPTTIDTTSLHTPAKSSTRGKDSTIIGWTGSHSTLKYLETLEPVLQAIEHEFPTVQFIVIADRRPKLALKRLDFRMWSEKTEISDLRLMDIGIMPLPDDQWTRGKCGFKALQYMALAIPTIASPVGVNTSIIEHGKNGFLAESHEEWLTLLKLLINNATVRAVIGNNGQQTVSERYSVASNSALFLSLFA